MNFLPLRLMLVFMCCLHLTQVRADARPASKVAKPASKAMKKANHSAAKVAKKQHVHTTAQKALAAQKPSAKKPVTATAAIGDVFASVVPVIDKSYKISNQGDYALKHEDWVQAKLLYQQAQSIFPSNQAAFYGLGRCADHDGDLQTAIADYRYNIYPVTGEDNGAILTSVSNDVQRLMEFAILLSRAGLADEAVTIYNHGMDHINYEDGEQNVPLLYPTFGPADSQARYTPQLLQALAHAALSSSLIGSGRPDALAHGQQAVALAPDNSVVLFYFGQCLEDQSEDVDGKLLPSSVFVQNRAAAMVEYQKAIALGSGVVSAAVKKIGVQLAQETTVAQ